MGKRDMVEKVGRTGPSYSHAADTSPDQGKLEEALRLPDQGMDRSARDQGGRQACIRDLPATTYRQDRRDAGVLARACPTGRAARFVFHFPEAIRVAQHELLEFVRCSIPVSAVRTR